MTLIPLLAPLLLMAAALPLLQGTVARTSQRLMLPEWSALAAFVLSILSALWLSANGPATSPLIGAYGVGLSVRLDMVSVTMLLLVSFIGWVILRYARVNTDGEPGQARFMVRMAATLASVMLLVTAGNLGQLVLAWVLIGVALNGLLLFYADRPAAQRAARKKALTGMGASFALVVAAAALTYAHGTGDIATILAADPTGFTTLAAAGLALAAILKSAQAPFHGWLTEVMEAPTPVSALLHAGVVNAGGFLLIRFADVLLAAPGIMAALVAIGGFSAIFGGLVMLTQPAVKTSLAWSTLAQMGFMVMQCGLALFPLALLHIVAHSLYKAHAFLAAGGAVELVASQRRPGPVAAPGPRAVALAFVIALGIYAVGGLAFGLAGKSAQGIALGAILIFGVAYLIAQGLADAAPRALMWRTGAAALAATLSYFALQTGANWLAAGTLPLPPAPGPLEWALIGLALVSFGFVAVAQAMFPLWARHPAAAGLRVHLMNGLYLNAIFDRLIGGWSRTQ